MAQQPPVLSIVIGSQNAQHSVRECLRSLDGQRAGREIEIILVDNSADGTAEMAAEFPGVSVIRAPAGALMPELWELGIRRGTAPIVALTTSHFIPRADWIERMLLAHESSHAGIGGAIENAPDGSLVDWAVYFNRYSALMPPVAAGFARDLAADNASYKRAAIERCERVRRNGFWEAMVHDEFRQAGLRLYLDPSIVVTHTRSFTLTGFIRQRFRHGRQYGSARAARGAFQRWVYLALSPALPLLLPARIARRVLAKRRHTAKFLLSLPILLLFTLSWSLGEASGYLRIEA